MPDQAIPIVHLKTEFHESFQSYSESIMEQEIHGIRVEHIVVSSKGKILDATNENFKTIYLFIKGNGKLTVDDLSYEIVPETIFLPNTAKYIQIEAISYEVLHYLKITSELTDQDQLDLAEFPPEHTQNIYYTTFSDCQSYSEPIKSPNTISRTILPNKYIPRIAMGTVRTKGSDEVGAHEHPMLEQLFLGLSKNNCVVYADNDQVDFPQYTLLHIPLGSRHSVSVEKDETMYYVWMDFFLDKKGEEWLKTHMVDGVNRPDK